jgi:hypothetical protein
VRVGLAVLVVVVLVELVPLVVAFNCIEGRGINGKAPLRCHVLGVCWQ